MRFILTCLLNVWLCLNISIAQNIEDPIGDPGGGIGYTISASINGPSIVEVGDSYNYSAEFRDQNGNIVFPTLGFGRWYVHNGNLVVSNDLSCQINWDLFGNGIVEFEYTTFDNYYYTSSNIIVNGVPTPDAYIDIIYGCGSSTIERLTDPPEGYDWWWQNSESGTTTSLGKSKTLTITASSNIYIRARMKEAPYTWSSILQTIGNVFVYSNSPPIPQPNQSCRFGNGMIDLSIDPVISATSYNWFLNETIIDPIPGVHSTNFTVDIAETTSYYVSALAGGCESQRAQVVGTVFLPPTILSETNGLLTPGNIVKLTLNGDYDSYKWYNKSNELISTSESLDVSFVGEYRAQVTKCEGVTSNTLSFEVWSEATGQNMNSVVSNKITKPKISTLLEVKTLSKENKETSIQYFDGLGRILQNVEVQKSPRGNDVIRPFIYNEFGHQNKIFLPVVVSYNVGSYKQGLLDYGGNYSINFYNQTDTKIANDQRPFEEVLFEASPLFRQKIMYGPGTNWYTKNKGIKLEYNINKDGVASNEEKIIIWKIKEVENKLPLLEQDISLNNNYGYYFTGHLEVNSRLDENGDEIKEYFDKTGKLVVKKVLISINPNKTYAETHYVYDGRGNLRIVLSPEGVKRLSTEYFSNSDKESFLKRWAFRYNFDSRNRLILKQIPSSDPISFVYDKRNRLIATQDGNLFLNNQWIFTKYDAMNRPVMTGLATIAGTREQLQAQVDNFYSTLTATTAWFETYVGNVAGNVHGYNNYSFPQETDVSKYLTVTYYDNYQFKSLLGTTYNYVNDNLSATVNGATYTQPAQEWLRVIGQVTGTKVKVLNGADNTGTLWLNTVSYYDEDYRLIQVISENYKKLTDSNYTGLDRTSNLYDFTGKLLKSLTMHPLKSGWGNVVGISITSNNALKTSTSNNWTTGGFSSIQSLIPGDDGYIEFTSTETNKARMVGLNDLDSDLNYTNINYAIYLTSGGKIFIYENGVNRGEKTSYATGDVFRAERIGTTIYYKKNGATFFTSAVPSKTSLRLDASFNSTGATINGLKTSFGQMVVARRFDYDHAGRLINTWHKLNNQPEILLVNNTYNELGQLIDKKLHSTVAAATDAKQSVDYRYNIRGWLTTINGANIKSPTNPNNDDNTDFFGMELLYENTSADLGNTAQFNGNISATKWSSNLGFGTKNQLGYSYQYDPLSRLSSSNYKEATAGIWSTPSNNKFSETGFSYDHNGNILALTRNDARTGTAMDQLTYSYTDGGFQQSNMLRSVTDAGDKNIGFKDGHSELNVADYTYDANGNMLRDLNKGIDTNIEYNYLNLPRLVTKSGSSIRYIYDATGRKLSQVVTSNNNTKQTDYLGEFVYEQDALQFLNHEEGRIVVSNEKDIYTYDGSHLTGITATSGASLTIETLHGEKYLKVNVTNTLLSNKGVSSLGGSRPVVAGQRYRVRVKGYTPFTDQVNLQIRFNTNIQASLNATFQQGAHNEAWAESIFTIPQGTTTINVGVVWNSTVTASRYFYINEAEITLLEEKEPEYQYHLKDHLGNTRVTFTSKKETESIKATMEDANAATEQAQFIYYNEAVKINSTLFDHTNAGTTQYATRLTGTPNERYGLAKSLQVMPGDTIRAEVFAKYLDPITTNWTGALPELMSAIAGGTAPAGTLIDMGSGGSTGGAIPPYLTVFGKNNETGNAPKAYLNFIVYDKDFSNPPIDQGYVRMKEAGREYGQDGLHEQLALTIPINQPGYVYIYLSNEEPGKEVYFDDFTVTHKKSPVIQVNDYYPFGLTFNSYNRENATYNQYKFSSKEIQDELSLDWYDFGNRMYNSQIGRWNRIDDFSDKYHTVSPYNYTLNNPLKYVDPAGDSVIRVNINDRSGYIHGATTVYIDHTIFDDFVGILNAAVTTGTHIKINSSFRTNKKQAELKKSKDAITPASPGNSPHNAGLGIDFSLYENNDVSQGRIKGNSTVTSVNAFIKAVKEFDGWRWGGDFSTPDKVHIDRRPGETEFAKIRDANQLQMHGDDEVGNLDKYVTRVENVAVGITKYQRWLNNPRDRNAAREALDELRQEFSAIKGNLQQLKQQIKQASGNK